MTLCYDAERAAAARRRRTGAPALLERLLGDCLHALPPASVQQQLPPCSTSRRVCLKARTACVCLAHTL